MQLKNTGEGTTAYSTIRQVQKVVQTIDVLLLAMSWLVWLVGSLIVALLTVVFLTIALLTMSLVTGVMVTAVLMEFWACATVYVIILLLRAGVSFEPVRDQV